MHIRRFLLAVFLGAIAAFAWNFVSWGVIELHAPAMNEFEDPDAVAEVLVANAPEHGVYYIPNMSHASDADPVSRANMEKRFKDGPFVTAMVRPGKSAGVDMQAQMIQSFATQLVGALIVGILLAAAGIRKYLGRVFFVALIGVFTAVIAFFPDHTWFEYPLTHVFPYMIDSAAAWSLAGIFMAALIRPDPVERDPLLEPELMPKPDTKSTAPRREAADKPPKRSAGKTPSVRASGEQDRSKTASKPETKPAANLPSPAFPKPKPAAVPKPATTTPDGKLIKKPAPPSTAAPQMKPKQQDITEKVPPPPSLKPKPKPGSD